MSPWSFLWWVLRGEATASLASCASGRSRSHVYVNRHGSFRMDAGRAHQHGAAFSAQSGFIVTLTGLLEWAGAIGVLWLPTVPWAAGGLSLLLLIMFPANIHYALSGLATKPEDAIFPRTLMQIVFLSASLTIMLYYSRQRSVRRRSLNETNNTPKSVHN